MAAAVFNSRQGHVWVGISGSFEEGMFKYFSSGKDYDNLGAAWWTYDLDGVNGDHKAECAVAYANDHLQDWDCDTSWYAICEINHQHCDY